MRDVWLITRNEIRTTLARKAFWLTTLILPVVVLLFVFLPQSLSRSDGESGPISGAASDAPAVGYVDLGGVLRVAPVGLPEGLAYEYDSEAEAQAALAAGDIDRYYLIAGDYLASGRLTVVQKRYQPLNALQGKDVVTYVINTGITGNEMLAGLLLDPTPGLESRSLAPSGPATSDDPGAAYFLPYLLMFVLYMALVMTSGFMLQSVSREKENRMAEVLLVSLRPRDLMLGKIAGLSAVGLVQVGIWFAVVFGLVLAGGGFAGIDLTGGGELAARVVPWAVVFFLLGYVTYACVYAVLGVLAPTARDANQFVIITIIPLVLPLLLLTVLSDTPDGAAATALSLFPLTSPVAMVARLGATPVSWWQLTIGAVLLAATAYLFVVLAGRLFHAGNLLSVRALSWQRLRSAFRPRGATVASAFDASPSRRPDGPAGEAIARERTSHTDASDSARRRAYMLASIAVVMVVIGIVEYTRGESSGLFIAVAGIVIAGAAYMRYRRGR